MNRSDPVGTEYYKPLQVAEKIGDWVFYLAAILSLATLFVEKKQNEELYNITQASFVLSVLFVLILGLAVRLHWSTTAQTKRMADFLSHAFDVTLIPEASKGFYNNFEREPFRRISASLLENTLFSKEILKRMLFFERTKCIVYTLLFLIAALNRKTDLALVSTVAQVVFGEQIISKWVRMEWLRAKVERIHEETYSLIQSSSFGWSKEYKARVIEYLLRYETAKAQAGISLSSKVFAKINESVSVRWKEITQILKLQEAEN